MKKDEIDAIISSAISIETVDPSKADERYSSLRNAIIDKKLIALTIEVSSACNLTCRYCGMHSIHHSGVSDSVSSAWQKKRGIMSPKIFRNIVDACAGLPKINVLYLHGMGEPLLNRDLPELIEYAKKSDISSNIVLITNGVELDLQRFKALYSSGLNEIRVSYDIFDPAIYKDIKGCDYSVNVRNNIENCLDYINNNLCDIVFTIEAKNWLSENRFLQNETKNVINHFHELVKSTKGARIRIANEFDWNGQAGHSENEFVRNVPCEQPFYMLLVHSDGQVSPCCLDTTQKLSLGNIKDHTNLKEILLGNKLAAIRKGLLTGDFSGIHSCKSCSMYSSTDKVIMNRSAELLETLGL